MQAGGVAHRDQPFCCCSTVSSAWRRTSARFVAAGWLPRACCWSQRAGTRYGELEAGNSRDELHGELDRADGSDELSAGGAVPVRRRGVAPGLDADGAAAGALGRCADEFFHRDAKRLRERRQGRDAGGDSDAEPDDAADGLPGGRGGPGEPGVQVLLGSGGRGVVLQPEGAAALASAKRGHRDEHTGERSATVPDHRAYTGVQRANAELGDVLVLDAGVQRDAVLGMDGDDSVHGVGASDAERAGDDDDVHPHGRTAQPGGVHGRDGDGDGAGAVRAYGATLMLPEQGPGYAGHVTDVATGLSYMQQRYYDPIGGRFLSTDPVAADAGVGANFNRYWYGNNNPYKNIDPDGRQSYEDLNLTGIIAGEMLGNEEITETEHINIWAHGRLPEGLAIGAAITIPGPEDIAIAVTASRLLLAARASKGISQALRYVDSVAEKIGYTGGRSGRRTIEYSENGGAKGGGAVKYLMD